MNQSIPLLNSISKLLFSLFFCALIVISCDTDDCKETSCNGAIPEYYDPVCGCNEVTYGNPDEAICHGIENYTKGECNKEDSSDCEEKLCDGFYLTIYDPVCGCNGKTYSNSGEAECKGITNYTKGECDHEKDTLCDHSELLNFEDPDSLLALNIKKWLSFDVCNYSFTRRISCFCTDEYTAPKSIQIENGKVILIDNDSPESDELDDYQTVHALFKSIHELHQKSVNELNVTYDETYGFPKTLYIDYDSLIADDEYSYIFSDFSIIE